MSTVIDITDVKDITYYIYTITNKNDPINRYVGVSKCFIRRMYIHRYNSKNENGVKYNQPFYKYIRDSGGLDNFECKIVDTIICRKSQIHELEKLYIDKYKATLNLCLNNNTIFTRMEPKKDGYMAQYYRKNRERLSEYQKKRKLNKCICV